MRWIFFVIFIVVVVDCEGVVKLSRRKRYLAFPEGSTLSIAICMTAQSILRPAEVFTEAVNWGVSYDLPNATAILQDYILTKQIKQRRTRRDLYRKIEVIMDSMGYSGRECIYRALCEASILFKLKGNTVVEAILKTIFSFPHQNFQNSEPEDHHNYLNAFGLGKEQNQEECIRNFPRCTLSLVGMALGHYSNFESFFNF